MHRNPFRLRVRVCTSDVYVYVRMYKKILIFNIHYELVSLFFFFFSKTRDRSHWFPSYFVECCEVGDS